VAYLADLRPRRAPGARRITPLAFKTGPGGLMDVDFWPAAACGARHPPFTFPSVAAMLACLLRTRAQRLRGLRRAARAGRAPAGGRTGGREIPAEGEALAAIAGWSARPRRQAARAFRALRRRIRAATSRCERGTIAAPD
jgi:hypothetical protein